MRILYPRLSFPYSCFHTSCHITCFFVFTLISALGFGWMVAHGVWVLPREAVTVRGAHMICIWVRSLKICLVYPFSIVSALSPACFLSLFQPWLCFNDLTMYIIASYQMDNASGRERRSRGKEKAKKSDPNSRNNGHDFCWDNEVKPVRYPWIYFYSLIFRIVIT